MEVYFYFIRSTTFYFLLKTDGCNGNIKRSHIHCCRSSTEFQCGVNEGHCKGNDDCKPGLKCGKANCPSRPGFQPDFNCCAGSNINNSHND